MSNMSESQVEKILLQIKSSETSVTQQITDLENKYVKALHKQEERHSAEIKLLRKDFDDRHMGIVKEIDDIRQPIEGRSENIKLYNNAVETAVKEVASTEYKKLQQQVTVSSEKTNSNKQYNLNWCILVYGVAVGREDAEKLGHTSAAMDTVYFAFLY